MKIVINYLVIAAAGALGAVTRYAVGTASGRLFGTAFPIGTFIINITGSFLLGFFIAAAQVRPHVPDALRLAIGVGFVGAYTTFSTFMYESNALLEDGAGIKASVNLIGSLIVGLAALRLGIFLAQKW